MPTPEKFLGPRARMKDVLARVQQPRPAAGATLLIYHRVGGGTSNELDLGVKAFEGQLDLLGQHGVVSLDAALDRLDAGSTEHSVVLTFDDGFEDVYSNAWPLLRERGIPFTVYLASAYVSDTMHWEGSTAKGSVGRGVSWRQLDEMLDSGLCTVGNHTHSHARPDALTVAELDACNEAIEANLGIIPKHFTYPWGVPITAVEQELRARFRSASTGVLGRNLPGVDPMRLLRVPVRRTDPARFFAAKLTGDLGPERAYAVVVGAAKRIGFGG